MEKNTKTFDEYISGLDEKSREVIMKLDSIITPHFGNASRTVWEGIFWGGSRQQIVGYGEYSSKRPDNTCIEWFMVGIAVQKNHYSIYCSAAEGNQYLVKLYAERLGKVKIGSSLISFTKIENLNLDMLSEMVHAAYIKWRERDGENDK